MVLIPSSIEMIGWALTSTIQLLKLSHILLSTLSQFEPSSTPVLGISVHHGLGTIRGQLSKLGPAVVEEGHTRGLCTHPKRLLIVLRSVILPPVCIDVPCTHSVLNVRK